MLYIYNIYTYTYVGVENCGRVRRNLSAGYQKIRRWWKKKKKKKTCR